ncbi:uncharacterized protein F5147DRAFT_779405 [Suillus discolor]|uniref:Uncharacterized protein n=1 Tax=Suillus discolor TaxID=1912936 RepID=A0A9P7EVE9_9AGAM|nr:uncharacterized protein F5147DRAFT_779405 [Suillus discolor]KAG2093348.1 hypothetical protein F5147DRAFT_779405 [Suillus discolor]
MEFLEKVDFGAVGVGEGVGIVSTRNLAPISTMRTTLPPDMPVDAPGSLRRRVEHGVDAIAGSTIKVISGVVDSSFNAIFALTLRFTSAPIGDQSRVVEHGAVEVREWVLADSEFGDDREWEGRGWAGQGELVELKKKNMSMMQEVFEASRE